MLVRPKWAATMAVLLTLLLVFSLVVLGCGEKEPAEKETYKVGASFSLSGGAASLGQPEENAVNLFVDQKNAEGGINGHELEVIILDDESEPTKAKSNITQLIKQDEVSAVIGSSTSGNTKAMMPVAEEEQVPLVCCAAATEITNPVNKWVFRTPPSDAMAIERVMQYIAEDLGIKKIAIINEDNAFGTSGADEIEKTAPDYDIEVVARESYSTGDTDMTAQLTKIQGTDAEALVSWGITAGTDSVAKSRKQLNMTIPMIGSHGIANQKFIELAGDAAEGVVFPGGKLLFPEAIPEGSEEREALDTFSEDYEAEYGEGINTFAAHGWDAIALVANAMEKAGSDPAKIRDELEKTTDFVGIDGIFNYSPTDHDGLKVSDLVMIRVTNGEWELIK